MTTSVIDINTQKADLRQHAFGLRKAARNEADNVQACAHLTAFVCNARQSGVVAGYMPIQTEVDPTPAMNQLHERGYAICVPVIQGRGMPLLFREWTPDCALIEGDFGALIPRGGAELTPDLAIVPLVGFDSKGNRLGYGGGFYDRTLANLKKTAGFQTAGFAFSAQELGSIPTNAYDQSLDVIITEKGLTTCD